MRKEWYQPEYCEKPRKPLPTFSSIIFTRVDYVFFGKQGLFGVVLLTVVIALGFLFFEKLVNKDAIPVHPFVTFYEFK